jgi:hypothetical protein
MASRVTLIAVVVLSGALLFVNEVLQRRNAHLVARVKYLEQGNGPAEGSLIRAVFGTDLNKKPFLVDYERNNRPSLLLVFSPFCKFTRQNWPLWNRLLKDSPSVDVVFADVTGEVSDEFFSSQGVKTPTQVLRLADIVKLQENFNLTPATVVVGPKGVVKRIVLGVLDDVSLHSLEAALRSDSVESSPKGGR